MITVPVALGERSYAISLEAGALSRVGALIAPHVVGKKALVIADETVARLHGARLEASLQAAGLIVSIVTFPAGESSKTVSTAERLWQACAEAKIDRSDTIIAFGGGVSGDLAGYVAACWMRGVRFVQIPTTLLAMVDSSVGGKTGINNDFGKNLLGAFWQPRVVLADLGVLATLPDGELVSALAEIIKYGVIYDAEFFAWQEKNIGGLKNRDAAATAHAVRRSCEIKAAVVGADERESGLREILNFGHTVGHAIENAAGYGTLRHGEAIAIGMVAESILGLDRGTAWTRAEHNRLVALIEVAGLPTRMPAGLALSTAQLLDAARSDKKARQGAVRYMLPTRIGEVVAVRLSDDEVAPVLHQIGSA